MKTDRASNGDSDEGEETNGIKPPSHGGYDGNTSSNSNLKYLNPSIFSVGFLRMGAACSVSNQSDASPFRLKFRPSNLRAPIFQRSVPEKVDCKANHKYCSEQITNNWFKVTDDDCEQITFEEYRKASLTAKILEQHAREAFIQMHLNGTITVDFEEFSRCFKFNGSVPIATGLANGQNRFHDVRG